ncbi:asparagine synthetase B [Nitzschia inconspicua]|uniref:Asparagine synthetase B n=1 Tax=Nitzschia inconspicua TaxID=303405 RepID=A0A9K3KZY6_9STRA|nr:asparagine synthetase B [Nitzschia inconspicua]
MYRVASLLNKRQLQKLSVKSSSAAAAAAICPMKIASRREMCGLVAAIDDVWTPRTTVREQFPILDDREALRQTTRILDHRGPDGYQISTGTLGGDAEAEQHARWSMGHTRLAIVDPSNRFADMPFNLTFKTPEGEKIVHLAANGEIYNHNKVYQSMVENDGWDHTRISGSDCEVIAHAYAKYGGPKTATMLDGMFAFVVFEEDPNTGKVKAFAARDPVGIKPLYYGRTKCSKKSDDAAAYVFSSELKALVGHADPATVVAIPPGHYWTPETGLVCYYNPEWLRNDDYAPWEDPNHAVSDDEIREAFTKAVQKRMMADVDYGFFLSGGVDSCIVAHDLLPLYRNERAALGDDRPIPTFTVGMENSPDVMAARGMVEALGGSKHVNHHVRAFTPDEVFDLIPKIIYHMETYEAELIRSAIPNWLLAERAAQDVKMVLTGEGADELFAGYLYFQDAETPRQVQNELRRIYGMLGNINLHRTDRMTMAHGLEARVPFLDTEFTRLVMSVDPKRKMVNREAVKTNSRGREKTMLRELFEGPNANGHSIPRPVLWRAKAMQCEGVGEDWVSILQRRVSSLVSDAEMDEAHITYPINTPQTKEELYYRRIYDENFHGLEHVVKLWEGGGRAMGAEWKSDMYTREGLKDVNLLSHSLQQARTFSTFAGPSSSKGKRTFSTMPIHSFKDEPYSSARASGYDEYEAWLTCGGDDRSLIKENTLTNKYHIRPQPVDPAHVFRGSCTGNPPTQRGYDAGKRLFQRLASLTDQQLDAELAQVFKQQRERIANLLQLEAGSEVIICPSGSDAEYLPLVIARAIKGDVHISNGITQLREIGAGSAPASVGKYFSSHAPLVGRLPDDAEYLSGFEGFDGVTIAARELRGEVVNGAEKMAEFVSSALARGTYPIVHGVFGGKTGIRDEQMPGSLDGGETSLGVVDACQGRFSLDELHQWIKQDSLVLFTASKFYQAPPFCGAVIIPPAIAEKLRNSPAPGPREMFSIDGLGGFLSDKELPDCLENWKPLLQKHNSANLGLALRWEAGLAGMEALASIPDERRTEAVEEWAGAVAEMVENKPELDAFCVERSIVSIRVAKEGGWLNMSELRDLYRWMSMDVSDLVPNASAEEKRYLSKPAYIGQPVDVAESHAIVRIALGVDSLLSYFDDKAGTLQEDNATVEKLAAIAKHFKTLKKSGM